MNLIKTSLLNGIAVAVKLLTMLFLNKLLAVYIGPAGFATIGQFHNAIQMITTFANGAVNNGVIKYTAEYYDDANRQRNLWKTAGTISLSSSIFCSFLIFVFNRKLAVWILNDESYRSIFLWFSAALLPFVLNSLMLAILNGKKEIFRYVTANIAGSILVLIITAWLAIYHGIYGALLALAVFQSFSFFVTLFICSRAHWFRVTYLLGKVDPKIAKNLVKYTTMAMVSAICFPLSQILIRNHLGETLGWIEAGYWEAMWRLSSAYLMLVTTTLSVYYFPRLSELSKPEEIKIEIFQGYKIILPVTAFFSLGVYLFRDYIILVLFTDYFFPMRQLFAWQMIGDTLKIGSWILSYIMIGKAMFKLFVVSEVAFSTNFVVITILLTKIFGLEGAVMAHAANYFMYWLALAFCLKRYLSDY